MIEYYNIESIKFSTAKYLKQNKEFEYVKYEYPISEWAFLCEDCKMNEEKKPHTVIKTVTQFRPQEKGLISVCRNCLIKEIT